MGLLDDAIREHLDLKRRRGGDPAEIERAEREALGPVRREPSAFADEAPAAAAVSDRPAGAALDEVEFVAEREDFLDAPTMVTPPADDDGAAVGIAHPDYADPEFDEFAVPADAAGTGVPADAPSFSNDFSDETDDEPEPKHRRRLFGRRSHDDGDDVAPEPVVDLPADDPFTPEPAGLEPGIEEAVGRAQPIDRAEPPVVPPPVTPPPTLRISTETEPGNTVEYDVEKAFRDEDAAVEPEDDFEFEDAAPAGPSTQEEDILEETPDFLADTPDHDRLWFEQKAPPDFDFDN